MTALTTTSTALQTDQARAWQAAAGDWLENFPSPRTRRAYGEAWAAFLAFAGNADPAKISQGDVIAFRRQLETTPSPKTGKTRSQSTVNLHLSALSSFFDWAKARGLRADNPVDGVTRRAVDPYGKATWLEEAQVFKLLAAVDATTAQGRRDRAIMLIMLTLGFRVDEVAGLKVGQLRRLADATHLTYTRKRGKTKTVECPAVVAAAIWATLKDRAGLVEASPIFTATAEGRAASRRMLTARGLQPAAGDEALTARAIHNLVRVYCDRAFGPGHGIHPHSLRHTAAKLAEGAGATMTEVGDLLGHASARVTTVYMHATARAADQVAAKIGARLAEGLQAQGAKEA